MWYITGCTRWYIDRQDAAQENLRRSRPVAGMLSGRVHSGGHPGLESRSARKEGGQQQAHVDPLFWEPRKPRRDADGAVGREAAGSIPSGLVSGEDTSSCSRDGPVGTDDEPRVARSATA